MRNLFFEERLDKSFFAERAYLLLKGIAGVPYDLSLIHISEPTRP
mgnify:CR=1 FL=1